MPLPPKVTLEEDTYRVYKTGIPFYDAARLIGVAHLVFGTASAEVEDNGIYWEVRGLKTNRDQSQVEWILEEGKSKAWDVNQKAKQLRQAMEGSFPEEFRGYFGLIASKEDYPALKEFDASLQYGPRGFDPLSDSVIVSSQGTKPKRKEKEFRLPPYELVVASLGFSFSAYARSGEQRTYILPVFDKHIVLSGFLTYQRRFHHTASGFVAEVLACLSILLDLTTRKLPVRDFVYTRIFGRNVFSSSGYLGLEKLCARWWDGVQRNTRSTIFLLENFRRFLESTGGPRIHEQAQALARWVADFVANPNVEALVKIEQLKARLLAASQNEFISGAYAAHQLLHRTEFIKEVRSMMSSHLPEVPWQVSEALARALGFDEKGWMNQFTRLENAPNFSQFIRQVEHIISRGYYREQQEQGKEPNIQQALSRARDLANSLKGMATTLQDEKAFRAWKAIFLLDVLSRARIRRTPSEAVETTAPEGAEEIQTLEEG